MIHSMLSPLQLLKILELSPHATAIYAGENLIIETANKSMLAIWGKDKNVIGLPMMKAIPELIGQPVFALLQQVIATGKDNENTNTAVQMVVEGKVQTCYFDISYKTIHTDDGSRFILHTALNVTEGVLTHEELDKLQEYVDTIEEELLFTRKKLHTSTHALHESEAGFERQSKSLYDLFMQAPAGICILGGDDLIYELVNPVYQQLLPQRALQGKPIFEALPELVGQQVETVLRTVYNTGHSRSMDEMLIPVSNVNNGLLENRYFSFNYIPRKNSKEETDGIFCFVYEVTELVRCRKTMQESENYFHQLADLVPAKISNALPTGEVVFFNKQWLDFSGLSFEDTRDFGYHKMMHPDEIAPFQRGLQKAAENGVPYISEMRFKNTDGQYIWHLNIAAAVLDHDGKIKMWVGSTTDIHALKQEEQRRSDFVSFLSHELKTPVTSLKGYVQLLLSAMENQHHTLNAEMMKLSLQRMNKNVDQFTKLIDEMLDLARADQGKLMIKNEPISLNDIVTTVVDDFRFTYPSMRFN